MEAFDWQRIFLGEDTSWFFLLEVAFRTVVMYLVLLIFFKITGKKEIKQLTVFELIVIVGLGSAAGDPMFYKDVPLLHALITFIIILLLYLFINYLSGRNHLLSVWLQGETKCVFYNNIINTKTLSKEGLNTEEFFSELRIKGIEHLGQVKRIYIEFSGELSVYYWPDDEVIDGLSILPEKLQAGTKHIDIPGKHSCIQCGLTRNYEQPEGQPVCKNCGCKKWVKSSNSKRIT